MFEKGAEQAFLALKGSGVSPCRMGEVVETKDRIVGHGIVLEVAPDVLGGIEFRRVGREELGMEVGMTGQVVAHPQRLVGAEAVPEQHDGTGEMALQFAEVVLNFGRVDVLVGMKTETEPQARAPRRHPKCPDDGDFLVRVGALMQDGGLPLGDPGAADQGGHQHPRLVQKHQVRPQAVGFFLMRGQSSLIQRPMASSSRSTARRSGRWALHPSKRRRRLTWAQ